MNKRVATMLFPQRGHAAGCELTVKACCEVHLGAAPQKAVGGDGFGASLTAPLKCPATRREFGWYHGECRHVFRPFYRGRRTFYL